MANSKITIASQASIKRAGIYKDAAIDTIKDSTAYDSMLMESNEEYMERLTKADKEKYDILRLNMQMTESESERASIRQVMADMRKDRVIKDTENMAFYVKLQNVNGKYFSTNFGNYFSIITGILFSIFFNYPRITPWECCLLKW